MGEAFRRLLQAVRLERDAFVWMDFNDRATGDALIFVVLTAVGQLAASGTTVLRLATSAGGINLFFQVLLNSVIFWLLFAGIVLFVVRMLFQAPAKYPLLLRVVGFAYPTLLVGIFTSRIDLPEYLALVLGTVWFFLVVARGVRYESELPHARVYGAVGLSIVLLYVVRAVFGGLL